MIYGDLNIYINKDRIFLNEAEDEDSDEGNPSMETQDTSSDDTSSKDTKDGDSKEETSEDSEKADEDDTSDKDNEDNDDFSIDTSDMDDNDSNDDKQEYTDNDSSNNDNESEEDSPEDDTKSKYDALYSGLSNEEKINKDLKLKEDFKTLYETISDLINKVNQIPNTGENIIILKRIMSSLSELKTYIEYYIVKIYVTKSFIENTIEFNKFLAIFNGIDKIFTDLEKIMNKEDK